MEEEEEEEAEEGSGMEEASEGGDGSNGGTAFGSMPTEEQLPGMEKANPSK